MCYGNHDPKDNPIWREPLSHSLAIWSRGMVGVSLCAQEARSIWTSSEPEENPRGWDLSQFTGAEKGISCQNHSSVCFCNVSLDIFLYFPS